MPAHLATTETNITPLFTPSADLPFLISHPDVLPHEIQWWGATWAALQYQEAPL